MSYVACGMCVPATIVWGGGENCGAVEITARGLLCATWLLGSGWLWSVVVPEASGAWGVSCSSSSTAVHCPEFCHRDRFPKRLSNHILTFRQALGLPQEKKLGLPHRWSSCQRSASQLLSRTWTWTIGQLMHFSDANNEGG